MNVTSPRRIRRTHSEAFKQSLIEACGHPVRRATRVVLFAAACNDIGADGRLCPGVAFPQP